MSPSDWIALTAILVGAALSAFTLIWQTRAERRRTDLRDSQARLASHVADVLVAAHEFQRSFREFTFNAPRGGGQFGPPGSDPATWVKIPKREAREHDKRAGNALDEMWKQHQKVEQALILLELYAPHEVVKSLRAISGTFTELLEEGIPEFFKGELFGEAEKAMQGHYDHAVATVREALGVPW